MTELFKALNSRLAQRFGLYVILTSTFITLFTSGFQIYTEYKRDINAVEQEVKEFESAQLSRIATNLWLLDMPELEATLENIISLPYIEFIAIYENEKLIIESGKGLSKTYLLKSFPLVFRQPTKENIIGKVVIHASLDDANKNIYERIILIVISNMVKTFLVALLILYIFYHLVAKHLINISHYTESLNFDNLNKIFVYNRKQRSKPDELDVLRSAFIRMQEHLYASKYTLKEREKEQSDILDSMLDAVISIDEKGDILSFNRAAESLFGYDCKEVLGKNIKRLMPKEIADKHDGYLKNHHDKGMSKVVGLGRDVTGLHKNNTQIPIRLFVAKLPRDIDGRKRFIGTCVDLTYIRSQEEQLRRSQKMDSLGKLTGGIAHDFNNLLGIVIGYSDLLKSALKSDSNQLNYVNEIAHAGKRGVNLTKKLLSFSKESSHEAREVDINALLNEQKDMLKKIIAVKIKLKIQLQADLWSVFLDAHDLEDAIINLSINAMHAMQGIGTNACIYMSTSNLKLNLEEAASLNLRKGEYVELSIRDTGKGMDKETKEKIFDPFFTTKGTDGTGLGLTQVFGFVKRSNAVVVALSEPNQGTEFNFYFPRYINSSDDLQISIRPTNKTPGGNETILVVDDESSLRGLTCEFLSQQGYNVISAINGKLALEVLKEHQVDLVLSDVIMPEIDGFQLASKLQEKYPNIKVQLVSGFSDERHYLQYDNRDFYKSLLRKPCELPVLLRRIRELLDGKDINEPIKSPDTLIRTVDGKIQPISWEERFNTGEQHIDKDHKEFLIHINLCIEAINNDDESQLDYVLEELSTKSAVHFEMEELKLRDNDYPLLERHKKVHQIYLDCIKKYYNEHQQKQLSALTLLYFLIDWLKEHIMGMDKQAQAYLIKVDSSDDYNEES